MIKKICICGKLINTNDKYCYNCQKRKDREKKLQYKEYDSKRKDSKEWNFYKSKEWLTVRNYILNKYNGLDLYSLYVNGKIEYANTIHHIIELNEDWSLRLDINNLFPCCETTHNLIHGLYVNNKVKTQELLRELLKKWNSEYGS